MSCTQFYSIKLFILRHAWLNLWDKHMTTGRINQVTLIKKWRNTCHYSQYQPHAETESEDPVQHHTASVSQTCTILHSTLPTEVKAMVSLWFWFWFHFICGRYWSETDPTSDRQFRTQTLSFPKRKVKKVSDLLRKKQKRKKKPPSSIL